MKNLHILLILLILTAAGCKNLDELQENPAAIYKPNPQLVFTGILLDVRENPWNSDQRDNQFMVINESFYGNQAYAWDSLSLSGYNSLRNVQRLEIEATKTGDAGKPYLALAKFLRAYFFISMSSRLGELPMAQALQGPSNGVFQPEYDTQEQIYTQSLQLLEDANTDISKLKDLSVNGDFYYAGDLSKWQKLINSFRLRTLISLSKRAEDTPGMNIKKQFSDILSNPDRYPLLLTTSDNFQLVYNSTSRDNYYTLWPSNGIVVKQDLRNNLGDTYLNLLAVTQDPRIFIVAAPTDSAKNSGDAAYATKFSSFHGGKSGELQTTLKNLSVAGKLSTINFNYWVASPAGVPYVLFGSYETEFSIAEAINRGWISGDAAAHYRNGITRSMEFNNIPSADIQKYFMVSGNEYRGNSSEGLAQILKQKYISFFENSGCQAYLNYRRTGIPTFDIGPANANNNQIPLRWQYPKSEYTTNEVNLKKSLSRQFNGSDTRNDMIWLIK